MNKQFEEIYTSEAIDSKEYDYEGEMAKTQLVTIADAAEELHDLLEDEDNMPEWCQNKITKAMDYLDTVRDYMISKDTEEESVSENFKKQYAHHSQGLKNAEADIKVAKTASDMVKAMNKKSHHSKALSKMDRMQEEVNMPSASKELETYARRYGGIDKGDFIKAAMMMKKNQNKQLNKFVDELDTEPREKILSIMKKHMKEAYREPMGQTKSMMSPLQKIRMDKEKKDRDRAGKLKPTTMASLRRKNTNEKLKVSDGIGAWIEDFYKSNAPQFKGKSREERRDMAVAAYLTAKRGPLKDD